jgi:hypothetical protein
MPELKALNEILANIDVKVLIGAENLLMAIRIIVLFP